MKELRHPNVNAHNDTGTDSRQHDVLSATTTLPDEGQAHWWAGEERERRKLRHKPAVFVGALPDSERSDARQRPNKQRGLPQPYLPVNERDALDVATRLITERGLSRAAWYKGRYKSPCWLQ